MAGFFKRINREKEAGEYISKALSIYKAAGDSRTRAVT
jgi:hypothetical protein